MNAHATRPLVGVFWMLVTGVLFVGVTGVVKYVGDGLPAPQSAFLRFAFGCLFFLPLLPRLVAVRVDGRSWRFFVARGLVHSLAVLLWFFAMTQIPMAEVVAMNYLAPVYVTLGAAVFLGERLALRRILAVLVALLGAVVILRPGIREVDVGHLAMLGAALFMGASYLIAKRSTGMFDPSLIVALLSVMVTVVLAPVAVAVWVPPTSAECGLLFVVAALATAGHYTMMLAFRAAPVSVTQPVTFVQLIWAAAIGWLVFEEAVDIFVFLGGGMIIAAISYIAWREARLNRGAVTPQPEATKL